MLLHNTSRHLSSTTGAGLTHFTTPNAFAPPMGESVTARKWEAESAQGEKKGCGTNTYALVVAHLWEYTALPCSCEVTEC